jgi:hypothetical protein
MVEPENHYLERIAFLKTQYLFLDSLSQKSKKGLNQ